jgi:hypothetical protein
LALQIILVAGIVLGDDIAHALLPLANAGTGLANAVRVMRFESLHGLWVEPAVQSFFVHTFRPFGGAIGWAQIEPIADALYGPGHVLLTLAFAIWVFLSRRHLFPFLRNIFVITNLLAIILYEVFPLAPPRLAQGLRFDGHPYRFLDVVFGGGAGLQVGFNEYAAMPSVHVAWALIVGLTLAWAARPLLLRALGLAYPLVMATTVIVTGNHYLVDSLGALATVGLATLLAMLVAWRAMGAASLGAAVRHLHGLRLPTGEQRHLPRGVRNSRGDSATELLGRARRLLRGATGVVAARRAQPRPRPVAAAGTAAPPQALTTHQPHPGLPPGLRAATGGGPHRRRCERGPARAFRGSRPRSPPNLCGGSDQAEALGVLIMQDEWADKGQAV